MKQVHRPHSLIRVIGFMCLFFVIGGLTGYLIAGYSDFLKVLLSMSREPVHWVFRSLIYAAFICLLYLARKSVRMNQQYQSQTDDTAAYQTTFRSLEYAVILFNVMSILVIVHFLLGIQLTQTGTDVTFFVSWLDGVPLVLPVIGQVVVNKTIQRVRQYKLPILALTPRDVKDYLNSLDEGEKQANLEQAHTTVFRLNQYILPTLYPLIFLVSLVSETNQLFTYALVAGIHLYINLSQYRMVRRYFH